MKVAVVGGGLAGLSAALDLVDAGVGVTLYEARPTLGGAVQTLPEREGDPDPPPDNGQHIALGCFTEYLRFLDRIGQSGSYIRRKLVLPVIAENGSVCEIRPSPAALLAYRHLPTRDRVRIPLTTARMRRARRVARRPRRRRRDRRGAAARKRTPPGRVGSSARGLADRQRPPLVRPQAARADARCAAQLGRALGLRPRCAHRPRAGAWPV